MEDYQKRVVDEKTALDENMERLDAFLRSEKSNALPDDERDRMARQHTAMNEYSLILGERIIAFV